MAFSRDAYDRFVEAYASLFSEEMTVVVELEDGPNLTTVVRGQLDGLSWRCREVSFDKVPHGVGRTAVCRWTVYNDDWVAVFESDVDRQYVEAGDVLSFPEIHHYIDLPLPASRLEQDLRPYG